MRLEMNYQKCIQRAISLQLVLKHKYGLQNVLLPKGIKSSEKVIEAKMF